MTFTIWDTTAQNTEGIYSHQIPDGSVVYAITNRISDENAGSPHFVNEINEGAFLSYNKIELVDGDSLIVKAMDKVRFINEIRQVDQDWLLFVHGDSKTFKQAVMRGYDIQQLHSIKVIVFSWPSRDPEVNGIKNFKNSKKNVVRSMDHFRELMQFIYNLRQEESLFSEDKNLSLFIHSLGNYYLENLMADEPCTVNNNNIFDNIIINAAAVNQDGHNKWVEKLKLQERIYITCNKQDFNLKGVRIFTKDGKQLGEKVTLPVANNAYYVHFTKAVGFRFPTGTTHTYFIGKITDESLNIKNFYTGILHGIQVDLEGGNNFIKRDDGLGYDIIF